MKVTSPIAIKDPMKHNQNGQAEAKADCCYVWFGRKIKKKKPQATEKLPNTDGPEFDVRNFVKKEKK